MTKKQLIKLNVSKCFHVFMLVLFSFGVSNAQTLIMQESFEDVDNAKYGANTFSSGGDYIELFSLPPSGFLTFMLPSDGVDMMVMEDVDNALNPLSPDDKNGYILFDDFDVTGYDSIRITLALGSDSVNSFEAIDSIMIEYAFDDDIAESRTKLNTGSYTTIGAFYGGATIGASTDFVQDIELDGTTLNDLTARKLDYILEDFTYTFFVTPNTTLGSIRLKFAVDGSEEIAVDNIRIYGIDNSPNVTVGLTENQQVSCPGNSDGQIKATVSTGTANYRYDWSNGSTTTNTASTVNTITGLAAGTYTVTVTDANGKTASESITVTTATDNTNPTASCQNITVNLDGSGNASIEASDIDFGSSDNCSAVTLNASPTSFTCADVGANSVTLTVTDASGNTSTCTSIVTVVDNTAPTASCQDITVNLDVFGNASIEASDINNGSSDNCSGVTLNASPTSFTCSEVGPNTVTLTVTDASGNTSTCTSTVTVVDNTDPTIDPIAAQTLDVDANCQASLVDYISLVVIDDNCENGLVVTQSPIAGTVISTSTLVTFTVTDANGNTATTSFDVSLIDATKPVITCPSDTVVNSFTSEIVNYTTPMVTDNCASPSAMLTAGLASGSLFTFGTTEVTYSATDDALNSSTCSFNVTVNDVTAIDQTSFNSIGLYPNPTTGIVNLEGNIEGEIEIFDLSGNVVMEAQANGNQSVLDLNQLESGKYIIRITNDNEVRHDHIQLIK